MLRRVGTASAVLLAVALGLVLLWPDGSVVDRLVVRLYVVGLYDVGVPSWVLPEHYALVLNVLAFVPFGWLGVVLLHRRAVTVVLALGGVSVLVELAQMLPVLHRQPSVVDVLCNTGGALLGALAGSLVREEPRGEEVLDEPRDVGGDDLG